MENEVAKFDTSCWNGQIFLDNTEWLEQNIKGIDQSVKEMLRLLEPDKDSLPEKVDACDIHKQPELISCIKEISHRHHLLANRYSKLSGEFSSQSKSVEENEKRTFDSQLTPPFLTPINKLRVQDAGSDLSSGGEISETTPHEDSESFSSMSSDSDSETYFMSANEHLCSASSEKMVKRGIVNMGNSEILDYEKELDVCNRKLASAEEEIVKLKRELKKNETFMDKMGSLESELLSTKNHIKLQESEMEKENKRSLMLQRKLVDLEAKLDLEKGRQDKELSVRDNQIQKLYVDLRNASERFTLEKQQLQSTVSELSGHLYYCEVKTEEIQVQCHILAEEKNKSQAKIVEMRKSLEALKITCRDDIKCLKVELSEKNALVDTLNQDIDEMKLKYDTVVAEKDGVNATLFADISRVEQSLHELHSENKQLSVLSESGNKLSRELKSRIVELEKLSESGNKLTRALESRIVELEKEVKILGEEKREAIRQLSFAIDHYRCMYEELRKVLVARKGIGHFRCMYEELRNALAHTRSMGAV